MIRNLKIIATNNMKKNFLNIADLNEKQIEEILLLSKRIEENDLNINLNKKKIGLIFEKPSTRTRLSFIAGIYELNGIPIEIDTDKLNLSRNETFVDTIKMFNLYLDALVIRTDNHFKFEIVDKYFDKTIINALSNLSHPCQILSDFYTLKNHFNRNMLDICWFGDVNNVLFSLIELSKIIKSIKLHIFTDKNFITNELKTNRENIFTYSDISLDILKKTDCIMTDVITSMNDQYDNNKKNMLMKYQITKEIMDNSSESTVFMHCLPANIGEEVTDEVINSKKSIVLKQAYNRKVLQKGLMSWLDI